MLVDDAPRRIVSHVYNLLAASGFRPARLSIACLLFRFTPAIRGSASRRRPYHAPASDLFNPGASGPRVFAAPRLRLRPPPPSISPVRLRPPESVRLQPFAVFYICAAYPRALSYAAVSSRLPRLSPSRPARRMRSPRSRRAPFVLRRPAPSHSGGIVRPARAGPLLCKNKQKFKPGRRPHHSADVVQNRL